MKHSITTEESTKVVRMADMELGQVGLVQGGVYDGVVVMAAYGDKVINLETGHTWERVPGNTHRVRLLHRGAKITIEVATGG
jgi:hypothetical protein